jgi:tetratricopeptide (TPR) repeat protein
MGELSEDDSFAMEQALRLSREGDVDGAEPIFQRVLDANRENPDLCWIIGSAYGSSDMNEKAACFFRRAIELDEQCMQAWGGLGRSLIALERWEEAEAALRRRLELGEHANHYVFLARALLRQSKYDEAITCCDRALQLNDRQVDALLNQGFAYSQLGHHKKAIELCLKAISIDSAYDDAHICLGVVLAQANDLAEASDSLQRAIDINPRSAVAYREFGKLQYLNGDPLLAKAYLKSGAALGRGQLRKVGTKDGNRDGDSIDGGGRKPG